MLQALCALVGLFGLVLVVPTDALAWGPGVHLNTADWVLRNLSLLPPAVAHLLAAHRNAFYYGCLSADIFVGKGCKVTPGHSHRWDTGLSLFANAQTDQLRAYAYGYLSHLAADTVAHNNYVPSLMSATPGSGKLSHVYIEMQADRMVRWNKRIAVQLFERTPGADAVLRTTTNTQKIPFFMKKQIFKGSVAVCSLAGWSSSLRVVNKAMPAASDKAYLRALLGSARKAVMDVLRDPHESAVTQVDPIGEKALQDAKALCSGRTPFAFRSPYPLRFPVDKRIASL